MNGLSGGGQNPPSEPETTVDERLDEDVREGCDQIEVEEETSPPSKITQFLKNFGEQLVIAVLVGAIFFVVGLWWNGTIEVVAGDENPPEVTIGVDPNLKSGAIID